MKLTFHLLVLHIPMGHGLLYYSVPARRPLLVLLFFILNLNYCIITVIICVTIIVTGSNSSSSNQCINIWPVPPSSPIPNLLYTACITVFQLSFLLSLCPSLSMSLLSLCLFLSPTGQSRKPPTQDLELLKGMFSLPLLPGACS